MGAAVLVTGQGKWRRQGGGKARPTGFEEMLLKMVTSLIVRATSRRCGGRLGHTSTESNTKVEHRRLLGRSTRKWLPNEQKSSLYVTSRTGLALRHGVALSKEPDGGVPGQIFANLWAGKGRGATNSLGEHTERQPADPGEGRFSAGRMRGASCLCSCLAEKAGGPVHDRA